MWLPLFRSADLQICCVPDLPCHDEKTASLSLKIVESNPNNSQKSVEYGIKSKNSYSVSVKSTDICSNVMQRMRISNASLLERVAKVLASSVGSLVSINKITNTLQSTGRSVDQKTIDKYIDGLNNSMLFYEARRWDVKGRKLLSRLSKYYIVDLGLRSNLIEGSARDLGHLLENVVYLELIRRFDNVYVGMLPAGEIDFVATDKDGVYYFQVAASVLGSRATMRRRCFFIGSILHLAALYTTKR